MLGSTLALGLRDIRPLLAQDSRDSPGSEFIVKACQQQPQWEEELDAGILACKPRSLLADCGQPQTAVSWKGLNKRAKWFPCLPTV